MKTKRLSFLLLMVWTALASAQTPKNVKYTFTEAADLTLIGRLFTDNPIPYHRVDTTRFHGFTPGENFQVRQGAGMACVFRTNSTTPYYTWNPCPKRRQALHERPFRRRARPPGRPQYETARCS